jgi:hypothetical protein
MKRKEENNSIKKHCNGNTCALARKATSIVFVRHKEKKKRGKEGEGLLKTFKWANTYAVHSIDLAIKSLGRYRVVSMQ